MWGDNKGSKVYHQRAKIVNKQRKSQTEWSIESLLYVSRFFKETA
jgi:hypothetical protein